MLRCGSGSYVFGHFFCGAQLKITLLMVIQALHRALSFPPNVVAKSVLVNVVIGLRVQATSIQLINSRAVINKI